MYRGIGASPSRLYGPPAIIQAAAVEVNLKMKIVFI